MNVLLGGELRQRLALTQQVGLADEILETLRAQPFSQRAAVERQLAVCVQP